MLSSSHLIVPTKILGSDDSITTSGANTLTLTKSHDRIRSHTETVIFDYGRCVGGISVFHIQDVQGNGPVQVRIVYSETREGIDNETGDNI
jgi:hypothetical protein